MRDKILGLLKKAEDDTDSNTYVVAYDLNEPNIVESLKNLKTRLKIIIDDEGSHGEEGSAENKAEEILKESAGQDNVKRQHLGKLQHNKFIVVEGSNIKAAICGSTNFSWRGLYVQSNNAVVIYGEKSIEPFLKAFDNYWSKGTVGAFSSTESATITDLQLDRIDAKISFSPHSEKNEILPTIAEDILQTESTILYSLAFLYQTPGSVKDAIKSVASKDGIFSYGISDKKVEGLDVHKPDGTVSPLYPAALTKNAPEPFQSEPIGGKGTRMHHKFIVIDFNKPSSRVYLGSYNFSKTADKSNGENLLIVRDRKIATSYMVDILCMVDHYHFRVNESIKPKDKLVLLKPPRKDGEEPWWKEYYTDSIKIHDRELFSL